MRYVPTHLPTDPTVGAHCRDYTDPAEGNTGTCQECREPGMELDSYGLCEVCAYGVIPSPPADWREAQEALDRQTHEWLDANTEWIRDRTGESSESAVYVDNIPF